MKKHLSRPFTALGLAIVMSLGAPMSASAAIDRSELAEGDTLILFDCEYDFPYALGTIDLSGPNAAVTPLGNSFTSNDCFPQPSWDYTTETALVTNWNLSSSPLATMDLETGIATTVTDYFLTDGGAPYTNVLANAVDDEGQVWASGITGSIYQVNRTTGLLTEVLNIAGMRAYAFAFNPVDGQLYWVDQFNNCALYTMDPQDATFTYSLVESNACANIPTANGLESLTFDSNGTAWAEMDVSGGDGATLVSGDINTLGTTAIDHGYFTYEGTPIWNEGIMVLPGEKPDESEGLAPTGASDVSLPVAIAALVFAIGVAVRHRRQA